MVFSFKPLLIIFVLFVVVVGAVGLYKSNIRQSLQPKQETSSQVFVASDIPQATTEVTEVHSPDGKMNLIMEKIMESGVSTYSFFVSEIPETSRTLIFKKTLSAGWTMQMSPNAWSPDNKYFFIKEASGNSVDFFVFNASGEPFSDGAGNMDVMSIFNTKQTGHNLADVTGWDSQTLLHVFTTTKEGTSGPSYWFEVPSGAVIQLASR